MATKSAPIKEKIERKVTIWFLGALLTGFLAGVGAYRAIQEIAGLKTLSASALEDSARKEATLEKGLSAAQAKATEGGDRLKQAYRSLAGTRIAVMYVESQSPTMLKIKDRLAEAGSIVTLNEVSNWRGYPEYVGRLLCRTGSEEAAYQLKTLVSDIAVATPKDDTSDLDKYDVALWVKPRE